MSEWKQRCESEWSLQGAPMPGSLDWKSVFDARPLGRNLLKNPSPHVRTPLHLNLICLNFQHVDLHDSNLMYWTTSLEVLPYDMSGIPEGAVVCELPQCRYEESQLHASIYQLQVRLLGADKITVISEHSVSHVFSGYGPGVRYVHFQHRLKSQFMMEFYTTLFTGSSVMVRPTKTSS
ncbi:hypothetical protein F7725_007277 [Dissostichus mawsoni]|uniref:FBA domain-containing protein n=1 Tax=Dissostichus mawsoni TaxID=36200 RepID=A0A7J5XWD1_DISMA|nr:hypothetical protein F7725_007277 [Dissostichus mawsoni]